MFHTHTHNIPDSMQKGPNLSFSAILKIASVTSCQHADGANLQFMSRCCLDGTGVQWFVFVWVQVHMPLGGYILQANCKLRKVRRKEKVKHSSHITIIHPF